MVEVTFTVSRRVRRIAAHDPHELPFAEYFRQIFWGSGIDVPDDFEQLIEEIVLDAVELAPGEKALLSLQLPADFVIVIDPVTHGTQFLDVKGRSDAPNVRTCRSCSTSARPPEPRPCVPAAAPVAREPYRHPESCRIVDRRTSSTSSSAAQAFSDGKTAAHQPRFATSTH
jgi:hypothetical protein